MPTQPTTFSRAHIPQQWTAAGLMKYYFSGALLAFNREHARRATLPECRTMWQGCKETIIKHDRRYAGLLQRKGR